MTDGVRDGSAGIPEPNEILDALLARVDQVIDYSSEAADGVPLFAVEAVLTKKTQRSSA